MQYTRGLGVTTVCPLSVCDGRMPLQRNAVSPARGITVDGQSREEKSMCAFYVRLQSSFALAHTNHYMIKSSFCITQKTQIHPHGGHPCYICNLEHILLHSRAPRYTLAMHTTPPSTSSTKVPDVWAWMHQQCLSPDLKLTYRKQQSRSSLSRDTQKSTDGARLQFYIKISVHTV